MTALEIQSKMSSIFEDLKTIELKLNDNQVNLDKTLKQKQVCKEAVEDGKAKLKTCKNQQTIVLTEFLAAKSYFETVESFYEQQSALHMALQNERANLEKAKNNLQLCYNGLDIKLKKSVNNVLNLR